MKKAAAVTCVFLDIGQVLLTDGWDHHARRRAMTHFKLDWAEMEERHGVNVATFEEGKLTLETYLDRVVFYQKRDFTRAQFRRFMFAQSEANPEMIDLFVQLKVQHGLKIIVVSNESRELNAFRIREFKLYRFVDAFVSSCFIHIRKPDRDIFQLALDISQTAPRHVVFIDNTPMFVQIAESLGMRGIVHTDCQSTRGKLSALGLEVIE